MDNLDSLGIRFFYNGQFEKSNKYPSYVGGNIQLTSVERDNLSLSTIREQIADIKMAYHGEDLTDKHRLYWLFPGKMLEMGREEWTLMENSFSDIGEKEEEETNAAIEEEKSEEKSGSDWEDGLSLTRLSMMYKMNCNLKMEIFLQ
ncbi:hypothetical protein D1007_47890 [Hordeum vulgare]|nr:hypothetical protein D1007_47890 [Hordeum vulgare]